MSDEAAEQGVEADEAWSTSELRSLTPVLGGLVERAMHDDELLGKMLFVAREAGLVLLRAHGTVLPFAATLDASGDAPKTYFPRDSQPTASWDALLEAVTQHLAKQGQTPVLGALALGTTLASGDNKGLGIQVETRRTALFLVYPYEQVAEEWNLGDPHEADDLLVDALLAKD